MKKLTALITIIFLTGCQSPQSQALSYENMYSDYNCAQTKAEMARVSSKIDQKMMKAPANEVLDTALAAFAISQGYSVGDDTDQELQNLRVQFDTLDRLYIKKGCVK